MKSDREFIKGIYQKAKDYEIIEASNREMHRKRYSKSYRTLRPVLLTGMTVAFISVSVLIYQKDWTNKELNSPSPINTQEENIPKMTRDMPSPAQYTPISNGDTIITGEVLELKDNKVTIQVNEVYAGQVYEGDQLMVDNIVSQDKKSLFSLGEKVLLYLVKEEKTEWVLSNGVLSKYSYVGEDEGTKQYENIEGSLIDSSMFLTE